MYSNTKSVKLTKLHKNLQDLLLKLGQNYLKFMKSTIYIYKKKISTKPFKDS